MNLQKKKKKKNEEEADVDRFQDYGSYLSLFLSLCLVVILVGFYL